MYSTLAKLYSGLKELYNWPKYVISFQNWPTYVRDWLGFIEKDEIITYRLRHGIRLKARAGTTDRVVISNMLVKDAFALDKAKLRKASVIIDIGAHIGAFSIYAASLGSNCKVYAYEPERRNYELLVQNVISNGLQGRVTPVNCAVSGSRGTIELFLGSETFAHSTTIAVSAESIIMPSVSLGDVFRDNQIEKCDLLKINAEGAEYPILLNVEEDILSRVSKICMQCHDVDEKNNVCTVQELLADNDFRVIRRSDFIEAINRLGK